MPQPAAKAGILETNLAGLGPVRRGKVRDLYDLGEHLLFVATDRVSAFDWVLPTPIPDKGKILTGISAFWFRTFGDVESHLVTDDVAAMPVAVQPHREILRGRSMLVRKVRIVPVECVARGYLVGSGWSEYKKAGSVCGVPLPGGLVQGLELPEPIFTPTTKAEKGHDLPMTFTEVEMAVGKGTAAALRDGTLSIYRRARDIARQKGILLADTKLEWGLDAKGRLILADEVLTPDSSRFWPAEDYRPGRDQPSFDKQGIRDWLSGTGWDKASPPPPLPPEVVAAASARYAEAYRRLVGRPFAG